jgi:hypothetical protein
MEILFSTALVLHIITGTLALGTGALAIISRKGHRLHRRGGMVFFGCMMAVTLTGLYMSLLRGNMFLAYISVFTFYQCYSGLRAIRNKSMRPAPADWLVWAVAVANSFLMVYSMNLVLMVFGGISTMLAITDLRIFITVLRGQTLPKLVWLSRHIGMMLGTYIATCTAFLVVNVQYVEPIWLPWLLPTFLGVMLIAYFNWRFIHKSGQRRTSTVVPILLAALALLPQAVKAQPYMEGGNTRHRFAQLTLGTDVRCFPAGGILTYPNQPLSHTHDGFGEGRLVFGGTHFWGHADFYVAIPVVHVGNRNTSTSVETGARVFPWRIEARKVRPYLGTGWMLTHFQQGDGPEHVRHNLPVTAGLVYNRGTHLFELGGGFNPASAQPYYTAMDEVSTVHMQPLWLSMGYRLMLETTASAERDWQSGRTRILTDTLAALGRLNGLTIAIGLSSATFLRQSSHTASTIPFIGHHAFTKVFPDLGIGYYFHRPDVQFNLAFRSTRSSISAYGHSQHVKRTAYTMEAFRFLTDYHGFALFAGPAISYERLRVTESYPDGESVSGSSNLLRPGLTFGWDIRPNRLQSWYLRTNLRWVPNLAVAMPSGGKGFLDQLEFNFIQLVVFPGRMRG